MENYISAIIQAIGAIIASAIGALIATGLIGKLFKKNVIPIIQTYSAKEHDVRGKLQKAKENIYVVASVGNNLFTDYNNFLRLKLNKKVKLKVLIQDEKSVHEQKKYLKGIDSDLITYEGSKDKRDKFLMTLFELQKDFPDKVEIREFPFIFTASYIGIDIERDIFTGVWKDHSLVQIMIYQYGVKSKDSPLTYITPKTHNEVFKRTVKSILDMWEKGDEIRFDLE